LDTDVSDFGDAFNSGAPTRTGNFTKIFTAGGTYWYMCTVHHDTQRGVIIVDVKGVRDRARAAAASTLPQATLILGSILLALFFGKM
jgi:hypothetical protein